MALRSLIVIASLAALGATQVPAYMERFAPKQADEQIAVAAFEVEAPEARGQSALLPAGPDGHYRGMFRINGKAVEGLIDTGASLVVLPESVARRLGVGGASLDFRHTAHTANGPAKAALVRLDRIEIGQVRVRNVEALVLRDESLSTTLIGMTFLSRISAYRVEGREMRLVN